MSFQTISIEALNDVSGGMSGRETACRVVGGTVGGAVGAIAGATPNPLMAGAGAINTMTTASAGDPTFAVDALAAGGSLIPGASIPAGAWTGARVGSRAGALLCGYRP